MASAIIRQTNTPKMTMIHCTGILIVSSSAYEPSIARTQTFWLKFCTAIEWPADSKVAPRCCRIAFIGTMKKSARLPSSIIKE